MKAGGSEALRKWFAQSKVADAEGRPLVVYHGTRPGNDIGAFRPPCATDGIYFTPDPAYAEAFTEDLSGQTGAAGAIYPVFLSVQRPHVVQVDSLEDPRAQAFLYRGLDCRALKQGGFDGAVLYVQGELDQVIAFAPEQVKSAVGNSGRFDPASEDLCDLEAREGPRP